MLMGSLCAGPAGSDGIDVNLHGLCALAQACQHLLLNCLVSSRGRLSRRARVSFCADIGWVAGLLAVVQAGRATEW